MLKKIPTLGMRREDWLAERRNSLGGSEIGAVLGLNRWATPYSVWAEKTGRIPPKEDSEAMRQGRDLETYVAQRFTEKTGKAVQRYNYLLRNDAAPYLHANIDRRVKGERSGLECKTASALNLRAYASGEFPESYYAQCVSYLAVTGWDRWYLAALVLGKAFQIYQITTVKDDAVPEWCESSVYVSPEELEALRDCAAEFWEYILQDAPPPVDGFTPTTAALAAEYAADNGGTVELFGRDELVQDYFRLKGECDGLKRQMEEIKQDIQQDMGEASYAVCPGANISWKVQERRTFDAKSFKAAHPEIALDGFYKTTRTRVFRITKSKEKEDKT